MDTIVIQLAIVAGFLLGLEIVEAIRDIKLAKVKANQKGQRPNSETD